MGGLVFLIPCIVAIVLIAKAFEVERDDQGLVTLYISGSPDPWSGVVAHVTEDRVEVLDTNFNAVIQSLRKAARGASALLR